MICNEIIIGEKFLDMYMEESWNIYTKIVYIDKQFQSYYNKPKKMETYKQKNDILINSLKFVEELG